MKSTVKAKNRKYIGYYLEVVVKVIGCSSTTSATPATPAFNALETTSKESRQRQTRTVQ